MAARLERPRLRLVVSVVFRLHFVVRRSALVHAVPGYSRTLAVGVTFRLFEK